MYLMILGDPGPCVCDRNPQHMAHVRRRADHDFASVRGELDCVSDQIDEDAPHLLSIRLDDGVVAAATCIEMLVKCQLLFAKERLDKCDRLTHHAANGNRLKVER